MTQTLQETSPYKQGEIFTATIDDILDTWVTMDDHRAVLRPDREQFLYILSRKRVDSEYQDVVDSLQTRGLVRPLTCTWKPGGYGHGWMGASGMMFGDGHHRLAAAIDLGWQTVQMQHFLHVPIANDYRAWLTDGPFTINKAPRVT